MFRAFLTTLAQRHRKAKAVPPWIIGIRKGECEERDLTKEKAGSLRLVRRQTGASGAQGVYCDRQTTFKKERRRQGTDPGGPWTTYFFDSKAAKWPSHDDLAHELRAPQGQAVRSPPSSSRPPTLVTTRRRRQSSRRRSKISSTSRTRTPSRRWLVYSARLRRSLRHTHHHQSHLTPFLLLFFFFFFFLFYFVFFFYCIFPAFQHHTYTYSSGVQAPCVWF